MRFGERLTLEVLGSEDKSQHEATISTIEKKITQAPLGKFLFTRESLARDEVKRGVKNFRRGNWSESFNSVANLTKRALWKEMNKTKQDIDDYPYGGGAGMLLKIEPLVWALTSIQELYPQSYFILLSPQGRTFQQKDVERLLNQAPNLVFICGRYEGFDERIVNYVDEQISVGDFITMGGEIPALAITEALIRAVPGVIRVESYQQETFTNSRLDFASYAPPRIFEGLVVPEVLLSGDHQKIAEDINKCDLIILEEILLKLYNTLKDNQRVAIYEEIIEEHYLFSDSEKRELKSGFQQAKLFNHQKNRGKAKKLNLLVVEKMLNQQIQKNPSYGLPDDNTPERQTKLRQLQKKLEKSREKNQRELKGYLEEIFLNFLDATRETSLEILKAARNGEKLEEQFEERFRENEEVKEMLVKVKKEIAEKAAKSSQVLEEELRKIREQSQILCEKYKGSFEEGKKELELLEKRCQEAQEKLSRILGKISARGGEMRVSFGSGIEEKFEGLREFIGIVKNGLEENQEKLLALIIDEDLSFIKETFAQSEIFQLKTLVQSLIPNFDESRDNYTAALIEKTTAINHEKDLLKVQIAELEKERLEKNERILIENIKKVASYNYLPLGEEDLKKLERDSLQKVQEDFTKTQQIVFSHLKECAVILLSSSSGFTNTSGCDLLRLEQQAKTIKNECQAKRNKIQQLENRNRELTTKKQELTTQLAEQEELLDSFQKQIIKAEETEIKYNELELKYRTELQSFQVANNSIQEKEENLELFISLQAKKRELKQLKSTLKTKLENASLLKNLLTNQELLTGLPTESGYQRTLRLIENQLQQVKEQLQTKLSEEEISQLCQLQTEIVKLEMKLEKLSAERMENFQEELAQAKREACAKLPDWEGECEFITKEEKVSKRDQINRAVSSKEVKKAEEKNELPKHLVSVELLYYQPEDRQSIIENEAGTKRVFL
ncbi:11066_t:CDS:10 [Racocetra fulgida]|uniref:tRNA (guanine-N(1)-)-methyltransferase n=1 Tax=Racocetra fulgida TaxID=60492 RepID=A0A9N8VJ58_9GLOM|nr:11066_t:CDS:10 [Racocetra fulgida]